MQTAAHAGVQIVQKLFYSPKLRCLLSHCR